MRKALVTGGAGGLGLATARALGRRGWALVLWDVNPARVAAAAGALRDEGFEAEGFAVDVSDPDAVRAAAERVGPIDLLDNNAGVHAPGDFLEGADSDDRRTVAVNLESYLWCTRAFLPPMIERGRGHLVFIASAAGLLGVPGMAVYAASKHAVVGFAESLRLELSRAGHDGIGMTIVCPSFVDTGMFQGTTPPLFTRRLEPAALAEKIADAAESGRLYVREPFLVKLIPLLRVLPAPLRDALCRLTRMHRSLGG